MIFNDSKSKGRAGLCAAISYFGMNGYCVSIPLNDTQDYDLVVEKDNSFFKIQCKSTGSKTKSGFYRVKLDTWGGANGGTQYSIVKNSSADFLFVLTEKQEMYVIPVEDIVNDRQLTLNCTYDKYRVHFKFLLSSMVEQRILVPHMGVRITQEKPVFINKQDRYIVKNRA